MTIMGVPVVGLMVEDKETGIGPATKAIPHYQRCTYEPLALVQ